MWRRNTRDWLRSATDEQAEALLPMEERAEALLPPNFNIVSGLPDISEVRPRLSAEDYDEWCAAVIQHMLELLPPNQVAIFYQTPGRYSGAGGSWLDKGFLCQLGARRAGAACVWQKVVLFQDSVDRVRGGTRPGFINMLCFSKRHRGATRPSTHPPTNLPFHPASAYRSPATHKSPHHVAHVRIRT